MACSSTCRGRKGTSLKPECTHVQNEAGTVSSHKAPAYSMEDQEHTEDDVGGITSGLGWTTTALSLATAS